MYYQMLAFCELIGRKAGIRFIEAYTDRWMAEQTTTDESLEDPGRFWDSLDGPDHETEEIAVRLGRGKIAFRVEQCLWAKAMRPFEDPELAHAFTCYGDFPQIAAINPNFVLTRTMTLMQGEGVRVDLSKRTVEEMSFWHRSADFDELIICFQGGIKWETDLGQVEMKPGQMLVIPRGIAHRSMPAKTGDTNIIIEIKVWSSLEEVIPGSDAAGK